MLLSCEGDALNTVSFKGTLLLHFAPSYGNTPFSPQLCPLPPAARCPLGPVKPLFLSHPDAGSFPHPTARDSCRGARLPVPALGASFSCRSPGPSCHLRAEAGSRTPRPGRGQRRGETRQAAETPGGRRARGCRGAGGGEAASPGASPQAEAAGGEG